MRENFLHDLWEKNAKHLERAEGMMFATGVKALITRANQGLILIHPDGSFDLPGGRVEEGERLVDALMREIFEETSLDVEILRPVAKWSFMKDPYREVSGITFLCRHLGGRVKLSNEHTGFGWRHWREVARNTSIRRFLQTPIGAGFIMKRRAHGIHHREATSIILPPSLISRESGPLGDERRCDRTGRR